MKHETYPRQWRHGRHLLEIVRMRTPEQLTREIADLERVNRELFDRLETERASRLTAERKCAEYRTQIRSVTEALHRAGLL